MFKPNVMKAQMVLFTFLWRNNGQEFFSRIDVIQYFVNYSYKNKKDHQSYKIYFNPKNYSVEDELATLSSTPDDASVWYKN